MGGGALVVRVLGVLAWSNGVDDPRRQGADFLEKNRHALGVVSLESGLQYKVIRKGNGTRHPRLEDRVETHYEWKTVANYPNGPVVDSTYKRGLTFSFELAKTSLAGWKEALQLMVEGDKWELYIPAELAFGQEGHPPDIRPGESLVWVVEIVKVKEKKGEDCASPDIGPRPPVREGAGKFFSERKLADAIRTDREFQTRKGGAKEPAPGGGLRLGLV